MDGFWDVIVQQANPEYLLRMGLAVVLGGTIGLERELRGRAAGLRTLMIVCLGSTIIMMLSTELPPRFFSGDAEAIIRVDPGRIAAGIVTGIGFLGAGVVVKLGDVVRGVTTAASIWFVAALGIAIGEGQYALSVASTILVLFVLWGLHYLEIYIHGSLHRTLTIFVDSPSSTATLGHVNRILVDAKAKIQDLKTTANISSGETKLCYLFKIRQAFQSHELVKKISGLEGVKSVEWE